MADVAGVERADQHVDGNLNVKVIGELADGDPELERFAQCLPSGSCKSLPKALDQLRLSGLLGQQRAEQRH